MTADFQAANPKIKVEPTFVAYEALHDKIVSAAPAGTYDVVLIDVIWPAEFGSKGIVTDVSGQFPEDVEERHARRRADHRPVPGQVLRRAVDPRHEVPLLQHRDAQAAGVDAASLSSWDGVLAAAKAVKDKGLVEYPLIWSWKQAEALICDYTQLLGAFGGKFLSDDGKSVAFDTGGGLQALEFMKKTLDDRLTNPSSIESLEEDVRKVFSGGTAAMALNWTYMFNGANDPKESKVAGKVGAAPTPSGPRRQPWRQRVDGAVRHLRQQEPDGSLRRTSAT